MTVTIAGTRIAYDFVQIRTYLHHSEARIDVRDRSIASPGDLVAVTLNGAPILTATVTDVRSSYRHAIIDAVPAVLTTMRRDTLPALIGDGRRAPALARQILGVEADLAAFDMPLTRWTTRPRPVSWAWESFLRTLAGVTSLPIGWRFDARDNLTRVEADRSAVERRHAAARDPQRRRVDHLYRDADSKPATCCPAGTRWWSRRRWCAPTCGGRWCTRRRRARPSTATACRAGAPAAVR